MKKLIAVLVCILSALSFAACSQTGTANESERAAETVAAVPSEAGESASPAEAVCPSKTPEAVQTDEKSTGGEPTSAVLVAYFSATGTTKGAAEKIAQASGADLYEILPTEPYSDEDLNYHSDASRTTIEMNDAASRPEIDGEVADWKKYDTVYLGYPIWWGEAPRILDTFVESYDFDGKTIVPFCTSGSSGVGSSAKNLEALASGGVWLSGTCFGGNVTQEEIEEWLSEIGNE